MQTNSPTLMNCLCFQVFFNDCKKVNESGSEAVDGEVKDAQQVQPEETYKGFEDQYHKINTRNIKETMFYSRICINQNEDDIIAHFNLGNCLKEDGDMDGSIIHLKRVTDLDPNHHLAHYNLGCIYFEAHDLAAALEYFLKASDLNRKDAETWMNLALVYKELGDLENSVLASQKALQIDPLSDMAYYNLGHTYHEFNLQDEAIKFYGKAIQLNPFHVDALFNYGVACQEIKVKLKLTDSFSKGNGVKNQHTSHRNESDTLTICRK